MPAAAVIPAPIAYIKVVAVETLVVGCFVPAVCPFTGRSTRCQSLCRVAPGCSLAWRSFLPIVPCVPFVWGVRDAGRLL